MAEISKKRQTRSFTIETKEEQRQQIPGIWTLRSVETTAQTKAAQPEKKKTTTTQKAEKVAAAKKEQHKMVNSVVLPSGKIPAIVG